MEDKLEITPLGAGNEVGRSCVHLTYKGKNVLFDCGIHPAYSGMNALPFFDMIDPSTIDVLLITHFHLDHAASLPYFLEKTGFKGRVFMTHATKAVYKLLVTDYVKVSKVAEDDMLYTEKDIEKSIDQIEVIDFHQIQEVNGIKFWCYIAGHVLGAAMFMVDIAGVNILYTGDYSREEDRHLKAAEMPPFSPEICIIESTYGVQQHQPREARERLFTDVISQTVLQGGRVLIPAFALGRAQELLLILDDYWEAHRELQSVPIYYASPLANRCMTVYQTYINSMNDRIKRQYERSNPFEFKHIRFLASVKDFEDSGPSVVMASPGGLQSGLSRQLFDNWCQDKKNACVIPGYVVEGTLAKTILNEPSTVTLMSGLVVPLRIRVHYISFSAHADYIQTNGFLKELEPANIILVHGEANEMGRLRRKLATDFADQNRPIFMPKNCQTVDLFFKGEKIAKAVGRLAEKSPSIGAPVSGLLVKKGFSYQLLLPEDLPIYTQLATGSVFQRQLVGYAGSFGMLRRRLEQMFEGVKDAKAEVPTIRIQDTVTVVQESTEKVILQWVSDPVSDMVADSVVAIILDLGGSNEGEILSLLDTESEGKNGRTDEEMGNVIRKLLETMFGDVEVGEGDSKELKVKVDEHVAMVNVCSGAVDCKDEGLGDRIRLAVQRIRTALLPLELKRSIN